MEIYITLFVLIILAGIFSDKEIISLNKQTIISPTQLLIVFIVIFFLLSAFREGIGTDYYLYRSIYMYEKEISLGLGWGYFVLSQFFRNFDLDYQFLVAANTTIFLSVIYLLIKKYSIYNYISLLTLLGTYTYFTSFNTFRQMTSISIVLLALILFFDYKKRFISLLIFVFSIGMHRSSIMFLPLFLLNLVPFKKVVYIILMSISLFVFFLVPEATKEVLFQKVFSLNNFFYEKYTGSQYIKGAERGITNIMFFLFYWLITFKLVMNHNSKEMKMSWILQSFTMYILINSFLPYSNIVERMSLFFELLAVVTVPQFIGQFKKSYVKNIIKTTIIVIFLVRVLYVLSLNGDGVIPYMSIFQK